MDSGRARAAQLALWRPLADELTWSVEAACRGLPVELFFVEGRGQAAGADIARARAVCAACPVAGPCLDYALANPNLDGMWAGTSRYQRARLRTKRQAS